MYSKEEAKRLRQEFWVSFGKSFPRKWILYNTRVKELSFKFHFDKKSAMVSLDIESSDAEKRAVYFEKLVALKVIMKDMIPGVVLDSGYVLASGKEIGRAYASISGVSIHDRSSWQKAMYFLKDTMDQFEKFWSEYHEFIRN